jgi:hypothetical protein
MASKETIRPRENTNNMNEEKTTKEPNKPGKKTETLPTATIVKGTTLEMAKEIMFGMGLN